MPQIYKFNEFQLDSAERRLLRNGIAIPLAPKVFDTLLVLAESGGRLMTKSELMQRLWPDTFVEEVSLAQNISQLRKALGNGAGDSKIIETVAKQGYRFAAPIQIVPPETHSNGLVRDSMGDLARPSEFPIPVHGSPRAARKHFPGWWVLAGGAALAAVAGFFVLVNQHIAKSGAVSAIHSIAVLPLANLSTDPEQEFLADGITDNLITELATVKALRVISRTSVMQYKGTRKTLPEIARELNVDALVEGTLSQHAGQLHVTAQLVQAIPEQHIWAETFERPLAEAQSLQSEIARQIVGALRATMTREEQVRMRRSRATNSEAALLYLKGKYFWNKRTREGIWEAEKYFQQAIAKDGEFAEAYVGLADVYTFEGGWTMEPANVVLPRAEVAAQHALALDPENAEAHATLGLIAMNYEWDWPKAEREFKQAIRLNSNDATAHHWYSEYLGAQGRFDEGLAELRRAEELDPLSLAIGSDRGKMLFFARRYDESILQLHKTLEMDPGFLQAHFWLIRAYAQSGRQREADASLENLQRAGPDPEEYRTIATLVRAKAGRRKEAAQFADSVINEAAIGTNPARMLHVQMAMGHLGEAFTWMEKCYASHSTVMTSLKVNPDYDGLRGDPRFAKYLERVGLSIPVAGRGPG